MKLNYSTRRTIILSISLFIICCSLWSFKTEVSENSNSKSKIYCELYVRHQFKSDAKWHYTISVNHGDFLKYPNKTIEKQKASSYTSYIDALNYMSSRGWHVVQNNRHFIDGHFDYEDHFILEKMLD